MELHTSHTKGGEKGVALLHSLRQAHRMHGLVDPSMRHHYASIPRVTGIAASAGEALDPEQWQPDTWCDAARAEVLQLEEKEAIGDTEGGGVPLKDSPYLKTMIACALWAGDTGIALRRTIRALAASPAPQWPRRWRAPMLETAVLNNACALWCAHAQVTSGQREAHTLFETVRRAPVSGRTAAYARCAQPCDASTLHRIHSAVDAILMNHFQSPAFTAHTHSTKVHHPVHGASHVEAATLDVALANLPSQEAAAVALQAIAIAAELEHRSAGVLFRPSSIHIHHVRSKEPGTPALHRCTYLVRPPKSHPVHVEDGTIRISFISPLVCVLDAAHASSNESGSESGGDTMHALKMHVLPYMHWIPSAIARKCKTPQDLLYHSARFAPGVSMTVEGILAPESHGIHHDVHDTCEKLFAHSLKAYVPGHMELGCEMDPAYPPFIAMLDAE